MAFYQNTNTLTTPIPAATLSTAGNDAIDPSGPYTWNYFIDDIANTKDKDRREAFQEFVFMMLYYKGRDMDNGSLTAKFPHDLIYEKVLKFFVTTATVSGTATPVPVNNTLAPIFTFSGGYFAVATGLEIPRNSLPPHHIIPSASDIDRLRPQLRANSLTVDIKNEINIALATGSTTIGFFQETAALFAHFYLIRHLLLLNGHRFEWYHPISASSPTVISQVIGRDKTDDMYYVASNGTNNRRSKAIEQKTNLADANRPYFFNSIMDRLRFVGFNIPATPFSGPSTPVVPASGPPTYSMDQQSIFYAYFVKLLDPTRPVGALRAGYSSTSGAVVSPPAVKVPFPTTTSAVVPTTTSKNAIISDPRFSNPLPLSSPALYSDYYNMTTTPGPSSTGENIELSFSKAKNSFIEDLFVTIRSGNGNALDLAGQPSKKRPFFTANGNTATSPVSYTPDEIYRLSADVYTDLKSIVSLAINEESKHMMKYFLEDKSIESSNTILASGVGETTISLMGIPNFGLPLFNYAMSPTAVVSDENEAGLTLGLNRRNAIHIGVYALDLISSGSGVPSDFTIATTDNVETYTFKFVPKTVGSTYDAIQPQPTPPTNLNFYNVKNAATGVWSYYRKLTRKTATGNFDSFELVAEYYPEKQDLIFREFTDDELKNIFVLSSSFTADPVGSKNFQRKLTCKVKSASASGTFEELLTLVSKYVDEFPSIVSDNALYKNETFQLYNVSSAQAPANALSYQNLLSSPNEKKGVKLIFDLIANQNYTVTFDPPSLLGSYIGKIPGSAAGITGTGKGRRVFPDRTYSPKFGTTGTPGINDERNPGPGEAAMFEAVKYSFGEFSMEAVPAYPALPTDIAISLDIVSHVNPTVSNLDTLVPPAFASDFNTRKGSATNNQVLALLRSFGLLEGIVRKMMSKVEPGGEYYSIYDAAKRTLILDKLKEWLPEPGSAGALLIKCYDEVLSATTPPEPVSVVHANEITLQDYYNFKYL